MTKTQKHFTITSTPLSNKDIFNFNLNFMRTYLAYEYNHHHIALIVLCRVGTK